MFAWLFASPAERRLLPGGRFRGPTPFVIAIMTFAMMTVAAAAGVAATHGVAGTASSMAARSVVPRRRDGKSVGRIAFLLE